MRAYRLTLLACTGLILLLGCSSQSTGVLTVHADGTVTGTTMDAAKIEAASRANTRAAFVKNKQFDKVPFDGTDTRKTRRYAVTHSNDDEAHKSQWLKQHQQYYNRY